MFEHEPKLGELLVGYGLVTSDQLRAALESQVVHGGRIGTNLVELELVNIDQLALALGQQHGVPAASEKAFERVSSGALGAMPRAMCAACGACPLLLDGSTLHVALLDPHRLDIIQYIGSTLGMALLAYAAPQLRLLYYLEVHYQITRPRRYLRSAWPATPISGDRRQYLTPSQPPRLPAAPGIDRGPPAVAERARQRPSARGAAGPAIGSGRIHVVDFGEATGHAPTPPPLDPPLVARKQLATEELDIDISLGPLDELEVSAMLPETVVEALAAARDRTSVVRQLVQPILPESTLVVLFLVRGDFAVAIAAWGAAIEPDRVRTLVAPLSVPSLMRAALKANQLSIGDARGDSVQQLIANFLQGPAPREAAVVPIRIGTSTVNLLCVQSAVRFSDRSANNLQRVAASAGDAYHRLMQRELGPGEVATRGASRPPPLPPPAGRVPWSGETTGSWAGSGSAMPLDIPQQDSQRSFGRYELLCRFASGGMANLYLARLAGPERFEKLIAIKRIHDHLTHDTEFIQRFSDEARLAARISHPNVVQVIELSRVGNWHYIAMEYVDGEDIAALLNRTELPYRLAARIIANGAAGLHAAHELRDGHGEPLNVVHRDVSPQNLLISYQGEVKVVDFGVAQARGNLAHSIVGTILGKLGYMAPEQARGDPLDRRVDVYALGIVLYEITTRRRLFRGETEAATMNLVLRGEVTPPSRFIRGFPTELEQIVFRALERDPKRRYQTAEELQVALEQFINGSGPPVLASALAQMMGRVFADRIQQKKELLKRLTAT